MTYTYNAIVGEIEPLDYAWIYNPFTGLVSLSRFETLDPDVEAFLTATAITDATIVYAINILVLALKSNNLWTKFYALYPFVGGSATTHKYNLKNPLDTNAAFRLSFSGGWTHSANGALPNGTTGYAQTFLNENTTCTLNDIHISVYSRTNASGTNFDIGNYNGATAGSNIGCRRADGRFYPQMQVDAGGTTFAVADSLGLFVGNRTNSTSTRNWAKGALKIDASTNSVSKANVTFFLGALSVNDSPFYYAARQYAFASIGSGLSDADLANLDNIVTTFQTTLGRNV